MRFFLLHLLLWVLLPGRCAGQEPAILVLTIDNFRSPDGEIAVGIYDEPDSFTDDPFRELTISKVKLKNNILVDTIVGLKPGIYALSMLDDLNANGKMDFSIVGMPKEGFGFSNNARPRMLRGPSFESCSFRLRPGATRIKVSLQYY